MIPIVFSTDHNYIMPTSVTILSLLKNSEGSIYDIFVLISEDVTNHDKALLQKEVELADEHSRIQFIFMGDQFKGCFETRNISFAAYFRLLIPWIIPHYDKIIYCDVDIIIQSSLRKVYEINIDDFYVAGVNTPGYRKKSFKLYCDQYKLNPFKYINSGFLILNAKNIRKDNLKEKFIEESQKKYTFQDQDIINLVCRNKIKIISNSWNYSGNYSKEKQLQFGQTPAVIHYAGAKPWKTFTPLWNNWWSIYGDSVFYNETYCRQIESEIMRCMTPTSVKLRQKVKKLLHLRK